MASAVASTSTEDVEIYKVSEWAEQRRYISRGGHNALFTTKPFAKGDILTKFSAKVTLDKPNMYSVQVDKNTHIELLPEYLMYTNHSCDPTVIFNTSTHDYEALRDLQPGDELCFFYPSTEWRMDCPFNCLCGSSKCVGRITGASDMDKDVLAKYRLNKHIEDLLQNSQE